MDTTNWSTVSIEEMEAQAVGNGPIETFETHTR